MEIKDISSKLQEVAKAFRIKGKYHEYEEIKVGNVNQTYRITYWETQDNNSAHGFNIDTDLRLALTATFVRCLRRLRRKSVLVNISDMQEKRSRNWFTTKYATYSAALPVLSTKPKAELNFMSPVFLRRAGLSFTFPFSFSVSPFPILMTVYAI